MYSSALIRGTSYTITPKLTVRTFNWQRDWYFVNCDNTYVRTSSRHEMLKTSIRRSGFLVAESSSDPSSGCSKSEEYMGVFGISPESCKQNVYTCLQTCIYKAFNHLKLRTSVKLLKYKLLIKEWDAPYYISKLVYFCKSVKLS